MNNLNTMIELGFCNCVTATTIGKGFSFQSKLPLTEASYIFSSKGQFSNKGCCLISVNVCHM